MVRESTADSGLELFGDLADEWLSTQKSWNTQTAYRCDLESFGRWCAANTTIPLRATLNDIVDYQRSCVDDGKSSSTIRRRSSTLSSFFQFAIDRGTVRANPVDGSDRPSVIAGDPSPTPSLGVDFVESLLRSAPGRDARLAALVGLVALDGLKLGEVLDLDATDVRRGRSGVTATVVSSASQRTIVLHSHSVRAVRRCLDGRSTGPLLVSARPAGRHLPPRRLSRFGADHLLKQVRGPDGTGVTANALRRFYMSSSHETGRDISAIRDQAGLGDRRGVRRYLNNSIDPNTHSADRGSDRRPKPNNKEV